MENNRQYEEMEIDLKELCLTLLAKWKVIIASAVFCALLGFCFSKFLMAEKYISTTSVYISSSQAEATNYSNLQTGTMMTKDYEVLVKGRSVLETVTNQLELDLSYETLKGMVSVNVPDSTRIVEITVETTDPYLSQDIANAVREVSSKNIVDVMGVAAVNIVETANLPEVKSAPSVAKYTVLGGMVGGVISCGIAGILFLFNDMITTQEDVEKYLGLSTLGVIPKDDGLLADEKKRKKSQNSMKKKSAKRAKA